jgi:hypothetical protein
MGSVDYKVSKGLATRLKNLRIADCPTEQVEYRSFRHLCTCDSPRYTDTNGLPLGFEQASDFCLGSLAESENRTWCRRT